MDTRLFARGISAARPMSRRVCTSPPALSGRKERKRVTLKWNDMIKERILSWWLVSRSLLNDVSLFPFPFSLPSVAYILILQRQLGLSPNQLRPNHPQTNSTLASDPRRILRRGPQPRPILMLRRLQGSGKHCSRHDSCAANCRDVLLFLVSSGCSSGTKDHHGPWIGYCRGRVVAFEYWESEWRYGFALAWFNVDEWVRVWCFYFYFLIFMFGI